MGAWGAKPFENDSAGDWLSDLLETEDLVFLEETIEFVLHYEMGSEEPNFEAPESFVCEIGIAAAETVAALLGQQSGDLPDTLLEWIANKPKPSNELAKKAIQIIDIVENGSELAELWNEGGVDPEWAQELNGLRYRLNNALLIALKGV